MSAAEQGAFADPPVGAALAFRAALQAMARPGQGRRLSCVAPPEGLSAAAATLLLVLADAETPLWLPERLRAGATADWLRFHTNAPQATARGAVMFGVGRWSELAPPDDWSAGDPAYPDRSATLIVEVPALEGGEAMVLSGPGIRGQASLAPPLPKSAPAILRANAARFPLGLDFYFVAGEQVAGLPRSTRIGG